MVKRAQNLLLYECYMFKFCMKIAKIRQPKYINYFMVKNSYNFQF